MVAFLLVSSVCAISEGRANTDSDLQALTAYCDQAKDGPNRLTKSDQDRASVIAKLPNFKRVEIRQMLEELIKISFTKSRINEIKILCETLSPLLAANEKMLLCQDSLRRLQGFYPNKKGDLAALKRDAEERCAPRCQKFADHLNAALESLHPRSSLDDLIVRYDAMPLSLLLALRRLEGGKVFSDKNHNVFGQTPDGYNKIQHASASDGIQSAVDQFACVGITKCSQPEPAYQRLYQLRKGVVTSDRCPARISGMVSAKGIACYNPRNKRYVNAVLEVLALYKYEALDLVWREVESMRCARGSQAPRRLEKNSSLK